MFEEMGTYSISGSWVGHGVATVSVRDILVDERALFVLAPLLAVLDSGLDSEDVHSIDFETGNVLTASVVIGVGRRAVCRSAHAVFVV